MASNAKPPVSPYRPSRPDVAVYWRLIHYFAGPNGDPMRLHSQLHAAGLAPRRARPQRVNGKLISPLDAHPY